MNLGWLHVLLPRLDEARPVMAWRVPGQLRVVMPCFFADITFKENINNMSINYLFNLCDIVLPFLS
jgi:hypothetical protein